MKENINLTIHFFIYFHNPEFSTVVRKPTFGVLDQVRHPLAFGAIEAS